MGKRSRRKALRRKGSKQPAPPQDEPPVQDDAERDAKLHRLELEHATLLAEMDRHVYREAYQMFLAEGGDVIEQMLENGQLTMAAYHSQIRAEKEGGSGWGPTVTPYEDRMTRSLQMRLMRQKQEWIERCRQRILDEKKALEEKSATEEPQEEPADSPEASPQEDTPEVIKFGSTGAETAEEAAAESVMATSVSPQ
jgi:hypothetical protein